MLNLDAFVAAATNDYPSHRSVRPPVMFSNGMGVDSTAAIVELVRNPRRRDFDLADFTVVTAMTGDEFTETGRVMQQFMLPFLREYGVRYVQVCRAGQSDEDGYLVLDDSTVPRRMFMQGPWSLSDEMRANGTVPQRVGVRKCSARAKGWPLDAFAATEYGSADRRHGIGFAAEEQNRADRDLCYGTAGRKPWYPLIEWGWDRERCLNVLSRFFGIAWPRSCCAYCPFAGGSVKKNAALARRWADDPDAAVKALLLEFTAMALNPKQSLFKVSTARDVATAHGLHDIVDRADEHVARAPWAVYEVRWVIRRHGDSTSRDGRITLGPDRAVRGHPWRSIRQLGRGTAREMTAAVEAHRGGQLDEGPMVRRRLLDDGDTYPSRQRVLVAAPVGVIDKQRKTFEAVWRHASSYQRRTARR